MNPAIRAIALSKAGKIPEHTNTSKKIRRLDKKIARVGKRTNKEGFAPKRTSRLIARRQKAVDKEKMKNAATKPNTRAKDINMRKQMATPKKSINIKDLA